MYSWTMKCAIFAFAIILQSGTLTIATTSAKQQVAPQITTTTWNTTFTPNKLQMHMGTAKPVLLEITNIEPTQNNYVFRISSENPHLAVVNRNIPASEINPTTRSWRGNVTIHALFLGETRIYVELLDNIINKQHTNNPADDLQHLQLTIIRQRRIIDHIFTGSVALLVSLLYINFGAALDLGVLRGLITRPVGPLIGFISQFILMPLLSFALGYLIFPDSVEMQLGLFFTGVSPSGGASNIWAVVLGGNINLSVLMTTVSTLAAFAMMPFWLFTLGHVIFERGDITVPYLNIAGFAFALIVPLCIGIGIQRWSPRLTRVLVRLLKPISMSLLLFIIVFAIVTNLYLFELFSWQIVIGGLALPWLGYIFAWILAKVLRQNSADALTIAIETGIQNTGIAIFLLGFLPQPQADLTTVIPVAVAIMTPLPLLCLYLFNRITGSTIKDGNMCDERSNLQSSQQQQHIS